jgi:Na+/H+-dicarboxylate symporter
MDKPSRKNWSRRLSPTARISIAMILGGLTGALLGPRVGGVGEVGKAVVGLIKMLATPLIVFAVLDAFFRSSVKLKGGLLIVGISAVNGVLALVIGLTLCNVSARPNHPWRGW